ncbi:MAG TPA: CsgG/HfaB family protein [Spirochaetota bacterium]|nr:CsgG/HfaB family protein [Spirochaetota bacterium]
MHYIFSLLIICFHIFGDYFTKAVAEDIAALDQSYQTACVGEVLLISGEENELTRLYTQRLLADLSRHTRLQLVEREKLEKVLQEIELSEAGLTSPDVTLEAGKIISAQAIINLTIAELEEGTEIFCKMLDVEKGTIAFSASYRDFKKQIEETENELADALSAEKEEKDDLPPVLKGEKPSETKVLEVSAEQKENKISAGYRKNIPEKNYQRQLIMLKRKNPALAKQIIQTRKIFKMIATDREAFSFFIVNYKPLRKVLNHSAPGVRKNIYYHSDRFRKKNRKQSAFIRKFIKRNFRILSKDPVISKKIRQTAGHLLKKGRKPDKRNSRRPALRKKR